MNRTPQSEPVDESSPGYGRSMTYEPMPTYLANGLADARVRAAMGLASPDQNQPVTECCPSAGSKNESKRQQDRMRFRRWHCHLGLEFLGVFHSRR